MKDLPKDVLSLVLDELGSRQDFGTLFNCALTGKKLAQSALKWLYRIHNQSIVISSEASDTEWSETQELEYNARMAIQRETTSKWALLWKSIIKSSLGTTAYPYCLYIRALDLRNLTELLIEQESMFQQTVLDILFSDDMAQFLKTHDHKHTPQKRKGRKANYIRLNVPLILDAIGESITSFVSDSASKNRSTVALEDLSGNISAATLPRWTARLSKLKSITLYDGAALSRSAATAIADNCFGFDDLTFLYCLSQNDIDHNLASFFSGLRANSLQSFSALSANSIGPEALLSLNHHSKSLKALKLDGLKPEAVRNLSLLQGCTALEFIDITDNGEVDLEKTENDIFLEVLAWLGKCEGLRELHLAKLASAPAILTHVCLQNNIRLHTLVVARYPMVGGTDFHKALSHQTSLEHLELRADDDGTARDDIDILVESICRLTNLKHLNIFDTADYFRAFEIIKIASNLKHLEEFWFTGYDVTDRVWPSLSGLHELRSLNIHAVTSFTLAGILGFISQLHETNQGLLLSIMSQDAVCDLSASEQALIRENIVEKVNGKFDFVLFRDVDSDSDDSED